MEQEKEEKEQGQELHGERCPSGGRKKEKKGRSSSKKRATLTLSAETRKGSCLPCLPSVISFCESSARSDHVALDFIWKAVEMRKLNGVR